LIKAEEISAKQKQIRISDEVNGVYYLNFQIGGKTISEILIKSNPWHITSKPNQPVRLKYHVKQALHFTNEGSMTIFNGMSNNLWQELQRRNVIRAALTYGAVSWFLMQAGEIIFPILGVGEGAMRILLIGLVLLFPFWLLFAWVYEYTPQGFKKTGEVKEAESVTGSTGKKLNAIIFGGMALAIILLLSDRFLNLSESVVGDDVQEMSIAVLPFENKGSEEDAYFADGVSEDILTQLGKIGDLRVLSRFTIRDYDITGKSSKEIGEELKVSYLLSGSIRRAGEQLRISCQLIDTGSEQEAWSESYDRVMEDIFAIQSEVAQSIAGELKAELTPEEESRISKIPTDNLVAYNLYLKGREAYYQYDATSNEAAISYFKQAIDKDPSFALAWAGLADAYSMSYNYGWHAHEYLDTALVTAQHALELDSESAEAWKAEGLAYSLLGNYTEAKRSIGEAIKRNPNHDRAIGNLAALLIDNGEEIAEAAVLIQKAIGINPLNPINYINLANIYRITGFYEDALEHFETAIQLDSDYYFIYFDLAITHLVMDSSAEASRAVDIMVAMGDSAAFVMELAAVVTYLYDKEKAWEYVEGIEQKEDYNVKSDITPVLKSYLGKVLRKEGDWDRILTGRLAYYNGRGEEGNQAKRYLYMIACIYGILGDRERCLDSIERLLEDNVAADYRLLYEMNPYFDTVREDPRYAELIAKIRARDEAERAKVIEMQLLN
jgi:TolB-like protein/Flp pilus assembly protein TadD